MKRNHTKLLAMMAVVCIASVVCAQGPREIAQRASPSVVLILAEGKNGKSFALGSGFFIAEDIVATNSHVIRGAVRLYAKLSGRKGLHPFDAIIANDSKKDLALLRLRSVKGEPLNIGDEREIGVGDLIYVLGSPEGLESTFSQGNISAIRRLGGRSLIQITAPISHGSSGGPVLNSAGEVIGIAVGTLRSGQNLNFAIPVSELISLTASLSSDRKAREHYNQAIDLKQDGRNAEAVAAFKQAIQLKPDYYEAYLGLAWSYQWQQSYTDAVAAFKQAIRLKPDSSEAYDGIGASYERLFRIAEAVEAYKQSIRIKPDNDSAYLSLGYTHMSDHHYVDAIAAYKQAVRLKPSDSGYVGLGRAYVQLGRHAEAIDAFQQAISLKSGADFAPFDVGTYFELAEAYEHTKRHDEATKTLTQALGVAEQLVRERVDGYSFSSLGQAYEKLGRLVEAAEAYKQAIRLDPKLAGVCMWLGGVLEKLGQDAEAITAYKQAIDAWAYGTDGRKALAAVYIKLRDYADAAVVYKDWIRILPKDADAHYGLGSAYLLLGDKESALREHAILKQLKPDLARRLFEQISR